MTDRRKEVVRAVGGVSASVARNSRALAMGSAVSRITGFARSVLLVAALGSTTRTSVAYNAANTLPNMIFELVIGGVLSSVLVPSLVRAAAAGVGAAYAQRLLNLVVLLLGAASIAAVLCAPLLADVLAPERQRSLTATLTALMLPEMLFYGLAAVASAILNVRGAFASTAWAPVLNNLAVCLMVVGYLFVPGPSRPTPQTISTAQVLTLGIGTTLGVAAQAGFLIAALRRSGFVWRWRAQGPTGDHLTQFRSAAQWALLYVAISQVGVIVIQRTGSYSGSLTIFTTADLVLQIPFGVLVLSYLTAIMPRLSADAAAHDRRAVVAQYTKMCRVANRVLIPVTGGLIALGADLGVVVFGLPLHAQVAAGVTGGELIGRAIAEASFGTVPFALVMIQLRVFYALHDMRTPALINLAMTGIKVGLVAAAALWGPLSAEWLNVATSASYVGGAVVGHALLVRRLGPGIPTARNTLRGDLLGALSTALVSSIVVAAAHAGHRPSWTLSVVALVLGTATWGLLTWLVTVGRVSLRRGPSGGRAWP